MPVASRPVTGQGGVIHQSHYHRPVPSCHFVWLGARPKLESFLAPGSFSCLFSRVVCRSPSACLTESPRTATRTRRLALNERVLKMGRGVKVYPCVRVCACVRHRHFETLGELVLVISQTIKSPNQSGFDKTPGGPGPTDRPEHPPKIKDQQDRSRDETRKAGQRHAT